MTKIKCICNKHFSIIVRANTEADEKSAYDNVQVVPTQRISKRNSTGNASWGVKHREIGTSISADNASWGGANTENFKKRNSTGNASWRANIEKLEHQFLQTMQVGDDKEIFFLYHTMSHSLSKILK
ncbi:hypothetical protein ACRS3P_13315 [Staphylococcus aureus]